MTRTRLWALAALLNIPVGLVVLSAVADTLGRNHAVLSVGCALRIQAACTARARHYDPMDTLEGEQLLTAACDAGHTPACIELGHIYTRWRVQPSQETLARGAELFQEACDAGSGDGCFWLADLYARGMGVPRDTARARALVARGCVDLSSQLACGRPATSGIPLLLWLLMAGAVGSLALGVAVEARLGATVSHGARPRSWIRVVTICAGLFTVAGVVQAVEGETAWLGWILLGLAGGYLAGSWLLWGRRYRAARIVLAITGFLSLPLGVFAILVSREVADSAQG